MEPKTELQRNAITEARRKELETYQRALDIQWLNSRMEDGRMGRCLALIRREAEMEKDFQERTDHAALVNARAAKETALGIEIANVRREEACQLLRRHYLRERDPNLRELSKKLQAGYVCRDLKQQILHNEYKRLQEKAEEKRANDVLVNALYNDQEAKERDEKEKIQRTSQYCKDLQQQLVNRQLEKQCLYEDTLIEKKMLEEVMRTLSDEDHRELEQKREQTEKMRQEMVTFKHAREAWREKQKAIVVLEERQIEEQRKQAANRSAAVIAERARVLHEREMVNEKIAAKIMADDAARKEREDIIKLLQEQEYLEKNVQDDIAERLKTERVRSETNEALLAQIAEHQRASRDQRAVEATFRKETEEKMAADEVKEKEKQRNLREKGRLYSQELLQQIQENARRRQKEKQVEDARAKDVFHCDRAWREEVEKEREKLVEEHVPSVAGFLQAGVLRPTDLEVCGHALPGLGSSAQGRGHPKCNAQCRLLGQY